MFVVRAHAVLTSVQEVLGDCFAPPRVGLGKAINKKARPNRETVSDLMKDSDINPDMMDTQRVRPHPPWMMEAPTINIDPGKRLKKN